MMMMMMMMMMDCAVCALVMLSIALFRFRYNMDTILTNYRDIGACKGQEEREQERAFPLLTSPTSTTATYAVSLDCETYEWAAYQCR